MSFSQNPLALRIALIFFGLLFVCDVARGCAGDQFWQEPRGVKTWILRKTVTFKQPNAVVSEQFFRQVLSKAGLTSCALFERDLVGEGVHIEKALRTVAFDSPLAGPWETVPVVNQVMVRLLARSANEGVIEILSRTKIRRGRSWLRTRGLTESAAAAEATQRVADQVEEEFNNIGRNP